MAQPGDCAQQIVHDIVADLANRPGFRDVWDKTANVDQREIIAAWATLAANHLGGVVLPANALELQQLWIESGRGLIEPATVHDRRSWVLVEFLRRHRGEKFSCLELLSWLEKHTYE